MLRRAAHGHAGQLPVPTLARQVPQLNFGMNRALIDGLLRGLDNERVQAALVPTEGACSVELRPPSGPEECGVRTGDGSSRRPCGRPSRPQGPRWRWRPPSRSAWAPPRP